MDECLNSVWFPPNLLVKYGKLFGKFLGFGFQSGTESLVDECFVFLNEHHSHSRFQLCSQH